MDPKILLAGIAVALACVIKLIVISGEKSSRYAGIDLLSHSDNKRAFLRAG